MRYFVRGLLNFGTRCSSTSFNKTTLFCTINEKICVHSNVRTLGTSSFLGFKQFIGTENGFAHSVFEQLPEYQKRLATASLKFNEKSSEEFKDVVDKDWTKHSADSVANAFRVISLYGPDNNYQITNSLFDNVCKALGQKCSEMSDADLLSVLAHLSRWPQTETVDAKNFDLWKSVDKECEARLKSWDKDMLLYVSDHWYNLHLAGVSQFVWQSSRKLGRKPTSLTPSQLVQTMFYINLLRRQHSIVSMYEFEYSMEQCIDKLSINEIAVFVLGFFKTQTKIHSKNIISKILERMIENVTTIESIPLSALLKIIRYSITIPLHDKLNYLQSLLVNEVPRLSLLCCLQAVLVGTNPQVFNADLIRTVCQRYSKEIKAARLKDIERLCLVLGVFDYDPNTNPCIFEAIINELRSPDRENEIIQYPKCLPRSLYYLSWKSMFPIDLITKVMDPVFIASTYGKSKFTIDREVLGLDCSVEIECPNYSGPRIDQKVSNFLAKKYSRKLPQEAQRGSINDRLMFEVMTLCMSKLGGRNYCCVTRVLPHYEYSDIVFCVGPDGKLISIPEEFTSQSDGKIKKPIEMGDGAKWYCILVAGVNSFIRNTNAPLGSTATKLRQLQILGYHTEMLSGPEFYFFGTKEKEIYIKKLLEEMTGSQILLVD